MKQKEQHLFTLQENDIFEYDFLVNIENKLPNTLSKEETTYLLEWIAYRSQTFFPKELKNYQGCCGYAADLNVSLLEIAPL